jgi:UDP-glucose 4-epimerase
VSKSLITGGAGFIGSNLVRFLLDKGDAVRVFDNYATGKRENLTEVESDIEIIEGDIRDREAVDKAMAGIEVVYHLAALGSVPRSIEDPESTHNVNVNGTFNIFDAARTAGVHRLVFASSSSVYGQSPVLPQHEDLPMMPISPYAASKATGEMYARAFYAAYGLQSACMRYYNVFGPRQDPHSQYAAAIPLFVSAYLRDQAPKIFDDGEQSRGFTYIDNVMNANYLAATAPEMHGEAMNVSTVDAVTVNTVVHTIRELLGKDIQPEYLPPRKGDIKHSLADVSRAKELIGYEPLVTFDDGIRRAIDWYVENLK